MGEIQPRNLLSPATFEAASRELASVLQVDGIFAARTLEDILGEFQQRTLKRPPYHDSTSVD